MEKETYLALQNGSDIRGIAMEGVEEEKVNLTPEVVERVAISFVKYLSEKYAVTSDELCVGVGHDSRLTAESLKCATIRGLKKAGCKVFDCGLASTPSMFMSTVLEGYQYHGAVMITASHLPFNRNGMKFFTKDGGLESADIRGLLEVASEMTKQENDIIGQVQTAELIEAYSTHLEQIIVQKLAGNGRERVLEGLHIVVDASNGVSGYFVKLLKRLGADTSGSICLEPDGTFPNHVPNPEDETAMETIKNAVLDVNADLGVIFDTDGDRAAVVLSDGEEVNKNTIIALMAAILAKDFPGTTVVTDSVTSDYLTDFLENCLHMKHHRFKRGYKNVINEAIRLNKEGHETHLAIETSGHGAIKENYFLDDGAYMSVLIICELAKCRKEGRNIKDMIAGLKKAEDSREVRLNIQTDDFKGYGTKVVDDFAVFAQEEKVLKPAKVNYEGIRVNYDDGQVRGWALLRMSLHDPLLVLNAEADREGGTSIIMKEIQKFLSKYEKLEQK